MLEYPATERQLEALCDAIEALHKLREANFFVTGDRQFLLDLEFWLDVHNGDKTYTMQPEYKVESLNEA